MRFLPVTVLLLFTLISPAIYYSQDLIQPRYFCFAVIALFVLRMLPNWKQDRGTGFFMPWLLFMIVALCVIAINDSAYALQLYPVVMNIGFLILFIYSLVVPPSIIEKIARLHDANLPESGVRYTRKVTMVWSVFFLFNGCIAAWTVWRGDRVLWGIYNGLIAYILMGGLMAVEYCIRCQVRKTFENE
ncbi:MAG: hypothetical protein V3V22_01320 [Methylococcales bacterium]